MNIEELKQFFDIILNELNVKNFRFRLSKKYGRKWVNYNSEKRKFFTCTI